MSKALISKVGFVLAVYAAVSFVQRNVMAVPVVGPYLPK